MPVQRVRAVVAAGHSVDAGGDKLSMNKPHLSIILPVLNEAAVIENLLAQLDYPGVEVIVVDGGSEDATVSVVETFVESIDYCQLIETVSDRSLQMNVGARVATGEILLFLHADTRIPVNFIDLLLAQFVPSKRVWGRFDVRLSGSHPMFRLIEIMMNNRSWLTGICTGDQAIFIEKSVFERIGGYSYLRLMEDIDISKRLLKISRPFRITEPLVTSSRRWEQQGILKTIFLMWQLRLMYFVGVSPQILADKYYRPIEK